MHSHFAEVVYKLAGPFGAFLTNTSKTRLPYLTTLKAKSDHGSEHLHSISGIFCIIIAHYHKTAGFFVPCLNREKLESSKSKSGSAMHPAYPEGAYRIY